VSVAVAAPSAVSPSTTGSRTKKAATDPSDAQPPPAATAKGRRKTAEELLKERD
jgi:hypothetical protein